MRASAFNVSMKSALLTEVIGHHAVIHFVRPEVRNPLSVSTLEELEETFTDLESASGVKVIVFTGSGNTFASGADLREVAELDENSAYEFARRGQSMMQRIYRSEKRTVAAIDGFCMGGALDLALSCKRRIASARSVFSHPGARLGIITGWGGTQLLPRLIGQTRALEIFLTAKRVSAAEALNIGLIDEISEKPLEAVLAESAF